MSASPVKVNRRVRPLTYIAAVVSILVTAAWWFYLVGPAAEVFPPYFEYHIVDTVLELLLATLVGVDDARI